jgi:hypothetical protein
LAEVLLRRIIDLKFNIRNIKTQILIAVVALFCMNLSSCYLEDTELPFIGYDYYPTELGTYVEYQVDSVWQDDQIGPIGSAEAHYFLRDINESSFVDEEGRPAIRVERYSKQNQLGDFSNVKDIWYRTRTSKIAEQNEENVVFIKHNFPVKEGKTWDGNSKNTLQTLQLIYRQTNIPELWDYEYKNVHEPYTINGFTFDSTITVLQLDRTATLGLSVFAQEVYAKDIGLVHKQLNVIDIQLPTVGSPLDTDTFGFQYEMMVTDFGQ